jgi:protease-4
VAIITIKGTIITGEGFIKKQIDQAKEDEDVKAIVLRVNSPGGTVTGSDYIYHHLQELIAERKIPMVVSMGGLAASGGYYVSMACGNERENVIFAEPTTWTGSIGVIISMIDLSELLNEYGVKDNTIASHDLKTMGSMLRPMTEEEREIWQGLIDEVFDRFKNIVKSGRAKFEENPDALDELATGQVFTAKQAKENGLIDEIGFIEQAIDRAIELANLDEDDVNVVRYKREPTLADILIGVQAEKPGLDLETLLEMNTPRAYYLFTRSPALLKSP